MSGQTSLLDYAATRLPEPAAPPAPAKPAGPAKPTIGEQRVAVEAAIEELDPRNIGGPLIAHLKQAALTLGWLERRRELFVEIARLDRDAPELLELLRVFPGAKIEGVR